MSTSNRKVIANRLNGTKSHGPRNTTSTRFSATKHGLLAVGITELDDAEEYKNILRDLMRDKSPVGAVETFLVKSAALDMVRWSRARRLEAEFITGVLNPPQHGKNPLSDLDPSFLGQVLDPGLPAAISVGNAQYLVATFQRYETFFANRLFRTLRELERMQRMREGERLPAPTAVDASVAETGPLNSVPVAPEQAKVLPTDDESLPRAVAVDVAEGESGIVDSAPAALEQPKLLSDEVDVDAGILDSAPEVFEQPKALSSDEE
jgi:hypothetical protein